MDPSSLGPPAAAAAAGVPLGIPAAIAKTLAIDATFLRISPQQQVESTRLFFCNGPVPMWVKAYKFEQRTLF